jgi:hypothetical protein
VCSYERHRIKEFDCVLLFKQRIFFLYDLPVINNTSWKIGVPPLDPVVSAKE